MNIEVNTAGASAARRSAILAGPAPDLDAQRPHSSAWFRNATSSVVVSSRCARMTNDGTYYGSFRVGRQKRQSSLAKLTDEQSRLMELSWSFSHIRDERVTLLCFCCVEKLNSLMTTDDSVLRKSTLVTVTVSVRVCACVSKFFQIHNFSITNPDFFFPFSFFSLSFLSFALCFCAHSRFVREFSFFRSGFFFCIVAIRLTFC